MRLLPSNIMQHTQIQSVDSYCLPLTFGCHTRMGNAALKQHFVNLLETNAPLVVKDLPYDKLLGLSVLGASVTLQRLEIQEQVLENFGIFLPFEIDRACLEEDKATREMQAATLGKVTDVLVAKSGSGRRPVELPRDVSNQPLLIRCLNSLNWRIQDIEIIFQMNDAEAKPWNLGVVVGASLELPLHILSKTAEDWHIDLSLEDLRILCARAEQTELSDRGVPLF